VLNEAAQRGAAATRPASREEGFVVMAAKASTRVDPLKLVSQLIDCGNVDTVYRDVYLQRARTLLAGVLPVEEFRRIEQQEAELAALPLVIGRALEKADWPRVKELSGHTETLRQAVEGKRARRQGSSRGRGHALCVPTVRLRPTPRS
jgi:hypothetical protein